MEEKVFALKFFHEHPLTRIANPTEDTKRDSLCSGCFRFFLPGEAVYGCSMKDCPLQRCLHEECAEIARDIRHPAHPSHTLTPAKLWSVVGYGHTPCAVCDEIEYYSLGYICKEGCKLWIHMRCAVNLILADEEHPQHELIHLRRPSSFKCDACGTNDLQSSYTCGICDYWIHEGCASLPTTKLFHHHPHHPLSLDFHPPFEYIKYQYTCDICSGALRLRNWVYHCELCRYIVHIKCANASNKIKNETAKDDDTAILKAPINNMYGEIIKPFVERQRGEISISHQDCEITSEYKFYNHNHPLNFLRFSSLSTTHDRGKEENDDKEDVDNSERSEIICNGCILPIEEPSSNHDDGYMSCGECEYFLHLACFNLPLELTSHPLHQNKDHNLRLQSFPKLAHWSDCDICDLPTNGLFYACEKCSFEIDIKCASLPETIKHVGHSQQHHYLKPVTQKHQISFCVACYSYIGGSEKYYRCNSCTFSMCYKCVLLPTLNKHRLEKHPLPLTYNARVNHPSDFYCSNCEEKMNPRMWMYHCRDCGQSFHPNCFPATSGEYRNIKFGQQHYHVSHHPHHSLAHQIISKKKYCNICSKNVYDDPGYQCTSCNFAVCRNHNVTEINQPID